MLLFCRLIIIMETPLPFHLQRGGLWLGAEINLNNIFVKAFGSPKEWDIQLAAAREAQNQEMQTCCLM